MVAAAEPLVDPCQESLRELRTDADLEAVSPSREEARGQVCVRIGAVKRKASSETSEEACKLDDSDDAEALTRETKLCKRLGPEVGVTIVALDDREVARAAECPHDEPRAEGGHDTALRSREDLDEQVCEMRTGFCKGNLAEISTDAKHASESDEYDDVDTSEGQPACRGTAIVGNECDAEIGMECEADKARETCTEANQRE
jgi:hypothetical protein